MMAIGVDRAIHLVTDGEEWDPQATATAIADAIRAEPEQPDLILFGNESADGGNYQVAIRVAYKLGLPVVTGVKGITVDGAPVRCEQEVARRARRLRAADAGGRRRARGDQPAALPVGAGAAAREAKAGRRIDARAPRRAPRDGQAGAAARLGQAGAGARHTGRMRRPRSSACSAIWGWCDGRPRVRREPRGRALPAGADVRARAWRGGAGGLGARATPTLRPGSPARSRMWSRSDHTRQSLQREPNEETRCSRTSRHGSICRWRPTASR